MWLWVIPTRWGQSLKTLRSIFEIFQTFPFVFVGTYIAALEFLLCRSSYAKRLLAMLMDTLTKHFPILEHQNSAVRPFLCSSEMLILVLKALKLWKGCSWSRRLLHHNSSATGLVIWVMWDVAVVAAAANFSSTSWLSSTCGVSFFLGQDGCPFSERGMGSKEGNEMEESQRQQRQQPY